MFNYEQRITTSCWIQDLCNCFLCSKITELTEYSAKSVRGVIKHCEAYGFWMALLYKGQELEREIISIVQIVQIGQMCEDNVKWLLLSCRSFIQIKSVLQGSSTHLLLFFSIRVTNYCQMVVPLIDAEFCFLEVICRRICVFCSSLWRNWTLWSYMKVCESQRNIIRLNVL